MARSRALHAPMLKKQPGKSRKPNSPKAPASKPPIRGSILDAKVGVRRRSEAEAWKLALEAADSLITPIICKYGLNAIAQSRNSKDMEKIVLYSLYLSALKWDEKRFSFHTYAVHCAKQCKQWTYELFGMIHLPWDTRRLAHNFLARLRKDPGYTLEKFAEEKGLPKGKTRCVHSAVLVLIGTSAIFRDPSPFEEPSSDCPNYGHGRLNWQTEMENPADLLRQVEDSLDTQNISNRMREIFLEVLGERDCALMLLRFGIGTKDGEPMGLKELGPKFDVSLGRAGGIVQESLRKLAKSKYAGELRGYMETLASYSQK
jgi:hypothetical protein